MQVGTIAPRTLNLALGYRASIYESPTAEQCDYDSCDTRRTQCGKHACNELGRPALSRTPSWWSSFQSSIPRRASMSQASPGHVLYWRVPSKFVLR